MIERIRIIGGPGSGKTHLAKQLSKKLNVPAYDLDDIKWEKKFDLPRKPSKRDSKLKEILKKKQWIIEGVYGDWSCVSFGRAQCIIILQPNTHIRTLRVIMRFVRKKLGLKKTEKEASWKSFKGLMSWSAKYYKDDFPEIYEYIKPHEHKVLTIAESNLDAEKIISVINKH